MRPRSPAVVEDVGAFATGILEGIRQDRKPVEGTVIVNASGKRKNG